jgi:hypothetical protein
MNSKECRRNQLWSSLRHYFGICLEEVRQTVSDFGRGFQKIMDCYFVIYFGSEFFPQAVGRFVAATSERSICSYSHALLPWGLKKMTEDAASRSAAHPYPHLPVHTHHTHTTHTHTHTHIYMYMYIYIYIYIHTHTDSERFRRF